MNNLDELKKVKVDPSPETWNKIEKTLHKRMLLRRVAIAAVVVAVAVPVVLVVSHVLSTNRPMDNPQQETFTAQNAMLTEEAALEVATAKTEMASIMQSGVESLPTADKKETVKIIAPSINVSNVAQVVESRSVAAAVQQDATNTPSQAAVQHPTTGTRSGNSTSSTAAIVPADPILSNSTQHPEQTAQTDSPNRQSDNATTSKSPTLPTESNLTIPNVVLPNADEAENRTFKVHSDSPLTAYRLFIYNRGGRLVYQTTDINAAWDCTHDGVAVPQGTYVYIIHYSDCNGKPFHKKGTVTVLR